MLRSYLVGDVELTVPKNLLPKDLANIGSSSGQTATELHGFPPIQTFEFEIATTIIEDDGDLQPFEFEVATIQIQNPIKIAEEAVLAKTGQSLNDLQKSIISGTLNDQTYNRHLRKIPMPLSN